YYLRISSRAKGGTVWTTWNYPLSYGLKLTPLFRINRQRPDRSFWQLYQSHREFLRRNGVNPAAIDPLDEEQIQTEMENDLRDQREKGVTPSTREIQSHFRFASQTSVMQYIAVLERKGFVDRHARKARALITPAMKVRITDIPIYGQIPAGMSALTEQNIEGHVSLDVRSANVLKNRGTFALRVRGDSMIGAHILDGDIVILEDTKEVHDG